MTEASKPVRERLLVQNEPSHDRRKRYEEEKNAMLRQMEVRFQREKWGVGIFWGFATLFITAALLVAGYRNQIPAEAQLLATGFVLFIAGGVEIVKHFINRSRIELLREMKGLESQVQELKDHLSNRSHSANG